MNKDLITKLAKLANNNPNDNEANAAARKVCRLLAEANYQFGGTTSTPPPKVKVTSNPTSSPFDDLFNFYERYGFYDGFKRDPYYKDRTNKQYEPQRPYEKPKEPRQRQPWEDPGWNKSKKDDTPKCIHCRQPLTNFDEVELKMHKSCLEKETTRIKGERHQCKCGHNTWVFSHITNSYFCEVCGHNISKIEAEHNKWRMK